MVGQRRRLWRRRALARRLAPALALAGVAAILVVLVVGAVAQIAPASGSYRRTVDRGYEALTAPLVADSNASAPLLRTLLEHGPSLDRGVFFTDLDQLVSSSEDVARQFATITPPSPSAASIADCAGAMAARARSAASLRGALEGLLGGPTGIGAGAGNEAAATGSVQSVGASLRSADGMWSSCRSSLRRAAGFARLPASRWISDVSLWAPGALSAYVAALTGSPTLAAVHIVAIVEAVTVPAASPGASGTLQVPPTNQLTLHVVVADDGNVDERGVQVVASLSETSPGGSTVQGRSSSVAPRSALFLTAGASTAVVLPPQSVDPGASYSLHVVVTAPAETTNPATATFPLAVATAVTTTSLLSSPSSVVVGGKVTYTATISASPGGLPPATGTVSFEDDSSPVPTCTAVALSHGQATCSVSYPSAGTHAVTADYSGDTSRSASTSAPLYEKVDPAPSRRGSS